MNDLNAKRQYAMYWKRTAFLYVPVPQSVLFICQVKTIVF